MAGNASRLDTSTDYNDDVAIQTTSSILKNLPLETLPSIIEHPWPQLLSPCSNSRSKWRLIDALIHGEYRMRIKIKGFSWNVHHMKLLSSKDGWILISDNIDTVVIVSTFTGEIIKTPKLKLYGEKKKKTMRLKLHARFVNIKIMFTSPSTSSDFMIFGITGSSPLHVSIVFWRYGEDEWMKYGFDCNSPFFISDSNPVFHNGLFYCLDQRANLATFDPMDCTWKVLKKPAAIYSPHPKLFDTTRDCFLVKSNGQLISVFGDINEERPDFRIYRLDESESVMRWRKRDLDLGDQILFLDQRSSFSVPAALSEDKRNRIYFPKLSKDHNQSTKLTYYDLQTKRWEPKFWDTRAPIDCVWI